MIRDVDLVSYLPQFIADFKETNITLTAEEPEFKLIWKAADQSLKNEFIATADEYGIARFEKILGILPENSDSLENRRVRIRNRWFNAVPYTIRMLAEKMIVLLGDACCFSIQTDIEKAYELQMTIYNTEDIMFNGSHMKEVRYLLANMVPMNIHYGINEQILLDISVGNMEQIALKNVQFKMGIPFWYELTFDGSWLLDGSVLLNSQRRYGLVLGIRSAQGGFHTSWRDQLSSVRFCKAKVKTPETVGARARFRFGFDFWDTRYFDGSWLLDGSVLLYPWRYGLSLVMSHKLWIVGSTEEIKMCNLAARWELPAQESIAASVEVNLEVEPLEDHKREKMAFVVHLEVDHSEQVGNVTVETRTPDHWSFNGEIKFDGSRKFNSIYMKEEI